MEKFTVTINYHGNYGYIEYDPDTKSAAVHLGVEEPRAAVEKYLAEPHTFKVCVGPTIRDFQEVTLQPLESLENFQLCLTRMWVAIVSLCTLYATRAFIKFKIVLHGSVAQLDRATAS